MEIAVLVLVLGFSASLLSGYLGIGGGILLAPALLYLPPLVGADALTMRDVAGLTMVQGLFACCSAAWRHDRYGCVDRRLVLVMGPAIATSALVGSMLSRWIPNEVLVLTFAALAAAASGLMCLPKSDDEPGRDPLRGFSVPLAVTIACAVGLLGGMVGQGGSFILIPLMLHVLRLPTRIVIGSNLALVLLSSLAGLAGKSATGQVPALLAVVLVLGALSAAQIGSVLSRATPARSLRIVLGVVVALGALGMVADAVYALT